ncbi:MAG: ABC transporter ATP-binding protein [Rhodanobacter sp.]|nr:MAG: ABC transporter ATP-binding protein [Rhodanobacter sp.]TAM03397.1 MAG: ABC transporter ATP-binding protein [Rhodanobacter sp.]TAM43043.1 MAG: ABC transporter ATP-binding protein [Rhodanobacter sp.]TAN25578.1 MAG: ABC transporter ATP-binding protein [Rhodanobacter sp.]
MATLELRGLKKYYGNTHAVDGIDAAIAEGEFLAILGPSGCGKSTTMRMIAGLEAPSAGEVLIGGKSVTHLPPRARNVSMVFQSYALYPHMSVLENIAFPLKARGVPRTERDAKIKWASAMLGIEPLLQRKPGRLSGGEKQKVALARSLVRDPALFIFDEPLSSLDAQVRTMARSELRLLHDRTGVTTVYVTHDQIEALGMGDRIAIMQHGRVRQLGTPQQLYDQPADTFVAGFLGSPPMNLLQRGGRIIGIRPEHLLPAPPGTTDDQSFELQVRIKRLEFLGTDWLIYGLLETGAQGQKVLSKVSPGIAATLQEGALQTFRVERMCLRFFDPATGSRVDDGPR